METPYYDNYYLLRFDAERQAGNCTNQIYTSAIMGLLSGGQGPSWIFIHSIDKLEKGLVMLFFGLFFSFPSSPGNFSYDALEYNGRRSVLYRSNA